MNDNQLIKVLLSPVVSEKSTRLSDTARQVVFKVVKSSTKPQIKRAVELGFNVKVEKVTVTSMPSKSRRHGRFTGKTQAWKKAYVSLAEGQDIDFVGAQE